jgi:hypothetical protein
VETCSVECMRHGINEIAQHVRAAKTGDSRNSHNDRCLAVFRECYADLIRSLGYGVR